jgi:hypothetical protein
MRQILIIKIKTIVKKLVGIALNGLNVLFFGNVLASLPRKTGCLYENKQSFQRTCSYMER